jgi:peroxiredoxin
VTFAPVLPIAELLTAAALLVQSSARWGALAALALLTVFAAGIASAMFRGAAPECHCFGQLHSAPAGPGTLIRNAVLAVPAVFVLAGGPGAHLGSWLPSGSARDVLAVIALAALAAFAIQLQLQNRHLRRDLGRLSDATKDFPAGPPIGAPAPRFSMQDVDGNAVVLEELLTTGRPVAMVFVSPDCGPCELLFEPLARWQRGLADRMTIVLASRASPQQVRTLYETYGLQNLIVDEQSELFDAYRTSTTPSAVIVTADGRVGTAMHSTVPIVEALIRRTLADLDGQRVPAGAPPERTSDERSLTVTRWATSARG